MSKIPMWLVRVGGMTRIIPNTWVIPPDPDWACPLFTEGNERFGIIITSPELRGYKSSRCATLRSVFGTVSLRTDPTFRQQGICVTATLDEIRVNSIYPAFSFGTIKRCQWWTQCHSWSRSTCAPPGHRAADTLCPPASSDPSALKTPSACLRSREKVTLYCVLFSLFHFLRKGSYKSYNCELSVDIGGKWHSVISPSLYFCVWWVSFAPGWGASLPHPVSWAVTWLVWGRTSGGFHHRFTVGPREA